MFELVAIFDSIKTDNRELAAIEVLIMLLIAAILGYVLRGFIDNRARELGGDFDDRERRHAATVDEQVDTEEDDPFSSDDDDAEFSFDDDGDSSDDDFDVQEESNSEEFGDFFDEEELPNEQASAGNGLSESTQPIEVDSGAVESGSQSEVAVEKVPESSHKEETVEIDNLTFDQQSTDPEPIVEPVKPRISDVHSPLEGLDQDLSASSATESKIAHFASPTTKPSSAPLQTSPIASFRAKDDLKRVEGIGPKIEGILNSAGIKSYSDLANSDADTLNGILREAGPRYQMHDATSWPKQAKHALNNEWDALDSLQKTLKRGK